MLNKFGRQPRGSPLIAININIALSFFQSVERLSKQSIFWKKLARVITEPGNNNGSPILGFFEFIAQGNIQFIPNRAVLSQMNGLTHFRALRISSCSLYVKSMKSISQLPSLSASGAKKRLYGGSLSYLDNLLVLLIKKKRLDLITLGRKQMVPNSLQSN